MLQRRIILNFIQQVLYATIQNGEAGIPKTGRIENLLTWPSTYDINPVWYMQTCIGNGDYNNTSHVSAQNIPTWINSYHTLVADPQYGLYNNYSLNSSGNINVMNLSIIGTAL